MQEIAMAGPDLVLLRPRSPLLLRLHGSGLRCRCLGKVPVIRFGQQTTRGYRMLSWRCAEKPPEQPDYSGKPLDWDGAWKNYNSEGKLVNTSSVPEIKPPNGQKPLQPADKAEGDMSRLTQWGGSVRGGDYQMGEGTDRIISIWANGDLMLLGAGALLILGLALLISMPHAPSNSQ